MKKLTLLLPVGFFLMSCASAYKNDGALDGKTAYVIECDQDTEACFEKAKEVCPAGYVTTKVSAVGATSLLLFPAQLRTIEVSCK